MFKTAQENIERAAVSWPHGVLMLALLAAAALLVYLALFTPPEAQAVALAWVVLP